jgi:hypothetical protein
LKLKQHIASLPAPQDRVDRFIERAHAVIALGTRTVEPVGGAVGPGNKAVGTRRDVDDDFPLVDLMARPMGPILMRNALGFPLSGLGKRALVGHVPVAFRWESRLSPRAA